MIDEVKMSGVGGVELPDFNEAAQPKAIPGEPQGPSFKEILDTSLKEVNQLRHNADVMQQKWVTGEVKDLHLVMKAVAEADLAFKLTEQIRNKLIDAYQELMRMQV